MHPIEFIEKNIRTYLLNEGFSQSVAQGGGRTPLLISIVVLLNQR